MPVYQPSAVLGNSRVLVTVGANGELMTFFYPHIDFAQNLHEGMPAVHFSPDGDSRNRLVWSFDPSWTAKQRYLGRTNLLETDLSHQQTGLNIRITDLVHPSEPILVRRFEVSNPTPRPLSGTLFQYLDLQLGEVQHRNAVHFHADRSLAIAYWRNICFAIGSESFDQYGCGRGASGNSAKRQMEQGTLNRQQEEIGDIDIAVGWALDLSPGASMVRQLVISADANELGAVERAEAARQLGWDALSAWTRDRWEQHVARARPVQIEPDLADAYYRCLLAIDLLIDPDTGSVLAAPEFDPLFERSGGYGYCWPRDAVEVCLALEAAGYPEYMGRFLGWAREAQRPEGYWEQRYWLSGQRGPAWCTQEDSLQIDQTASVLFAMGTHARRLDEAESVRFLEETWGSASRAADYLVHDLSPEHGLHTPAFDLWETFRGSFTYSNAAIAAALGEAAFLARQVGDGASANRWEAAAGAVKQAVLSRLWLGDGFARGLDLEGKVDEAADASVLGLIVPFAFLRLEDAEEREIARRSVDSLIQSLGRPVGEGRALARFEGDQYAGGGPGAVTTLWLARALLRLALTAGGDEQAASQYRAEAVGCMRAVLQAGTSTGLLPEMMGAAPGSPWAVPHAWTMASFVRAALLLDRLGTGSSNDLET